MADHGEVTLERGGRKYGATYSISNGMLQVKTHTETRSVEIGDQNPETLALNVLEEVVNTQGEPRR